MEVLCVRLREQLIDYACINLQVTNSVNVLCICILLTVYLGKPEKVLGDGGGAALDLHQWDLIFSGHQDVFLVVEHSSQVHAPNETNTGQTK